MCNLRSTCLHSDRSSRSLPARGPAADGRTRLPHAWWTSTFRQLGHDSSRRHFSTQHNPGPLRWTRRPACRGCALAGVAVGVACSDACMCAWVHGCMGAWVHGCMQGCLQPTLGRRRADVLVSTPTQSSSPLQGLRRSLPDAPGALRLCTATARVSRCGSTALMSHWWIFPSGNGIRVHLGSRLSTLRCVYVCAREARLKENERGDGVERTLSSLSSSEAPGGY